MIDNRKFLSICCFSVFIEIIEIKIFFKLAGPRVFFLVVTFIFCSRSIPSYRIHSRCISSYLLYSMVPHLVGPASKGACEGFTFLHPWGCLAFSSPGWVVLPVAARSLLLFSAPIIYEGHLPHCHIIGS
jgi:hypothetical protein